MLSISSDHKNKGHFHVPWIARTDARIRTTSVEYIHRFTQALFGKAKPGLGGKMILY